MTALAAARARRDVMAANPLQESPEEEERMEEELPEDADLERSDKSSSGYVGVFQTLQTCRFNARTPYGYMEAGTATDIGSFSSGALPLRPQPHPPSDDGVSHPLLCWQPFCAGNALPRRGQAKDLPYAY